MRSATFSQSFMKESRPRSVSGCCTIFFSTPNGTVAMSAPMSAALRDVVGAAHGGGDDLDLLAVGGVGREVVVVDGGDDVADLLEAVLGDVIETADERADVAGAGACGQQRLRHAEAQRHVHRDALGGQRVGGGQALDHGGDLHHDVRGDLGQLAAVGGRSRRASWRRTRRTPGSPGRRCRRCASCGYGSHPACRRCLAYSDGLVVTPASAPQLAASSISARSAVSRKNFTLIPPYIYGLLPALRIERALMGSGNLMMGRVSFEKIKLGAE